MTYLYKNTHHFLAIDSILKRITSMNTRDLSELIRTKLKSQQNTERSKKRAPNLKDE